MKKFLLLALALGCLFTACDDREDSDGDEKNLESIRIVNEAFRTGDTSKIDEAVAADFVDHLPEGDANRDSLKALIKKLQVQFPDMKTEIIREMADEEYGLSWMRIAGTSSGAMGMPPGPYDMQAIQAYRFRDGKIVEHWEFMHMIDMMKMMSQMGPASNMRADSSKKDSSAGH